MLSEELKERLARLLDKVMTEHPEGSLQDALVAEIKAQLTPAEIVELISERDTAPYLSEMVEGIHRRRAESN
jgi:hypothetical protein